VASTKHRRGRCGCLHRVNCNRTVLNVNDLVSQRLSLGRVRANTCQLHGTLPCQWLELFGNQVQVADVIG
jgi:hypothetical protein